MTEIKNYEVTPSVLVQPKKTCKTLFTTYLPLIELRQGKKSLLAPLNRPVMEKTAANKSWNFVIYSIETCLKEFPTWLCCCCFVFMTGLGVVGIHYSPVFLCWGTYINNIQSFRVLFGPTPTVC